MIEINSNVSYEKMYTTKDYGALKHLKGQRGINRINVDKIKASMKKSFRPTPSIVNEYGEIIDGQHTIIACEELDLPFHYIIKEGWGYNEAVSYNLTRFQWKMDDYLTSFIEVGKKQYMEYRQFMGNYDWTHDTTCRLLKVTSQAFKKGDMVIDDMEASVDNAKMLMDFISRITRLKRERGFVSAILFFFKHERYDHKLLLRKVNKLDKAIMKCHTTNEFIDSILKVYNKGLSNGDQIYVGPINEI